MKNFAEKKIAAELHAVSTPKSAASVATSAATRLLRQALTEASLTGIRSFIEENVSKGLLNVSTLDKVMARLEKAMDYRRASALSHVTIPQHLLARHRHDKCDELPILSPADFCGVIVLWAPMGSGKTRKVGRPFIRHVVEQTKAKSLAICHRVSLVNELATVLGVEHYRQVDTTMINNPKTRGLAICLPSITVEDYQYLIKQAEYVFVDEISQVLRFLSAADYCCTDKTNNEDVYNRLRKLVTDAKCVIVADAGCDARTIAFLETCRPGEKFRIIEVHAKPEGITATYHSGRQAAAGVVGDCLAELAAQGHVWIATESAKRARNLGTFFESQGYRVMSVYANNKNNTEQAAFLAEPERMSRQYDVIIASPVIGSGLSIEHSQTGEWFTLGAFIGGGHRITPADAAQALRRVRYLRRYSLGFLNATETGKQSSKSIKAAWLEASELEGVEASTNAFTDLIADITAANHNACADFAAGLLWQLERAKWTLFPNNAHDLELTKLLSAMDQAQDQAHHAALLAAPLIDQDAAEQLICSVSRTELDNTTIEAYQIRRALNVPDLSEALLDFWNNGAALGRLDRFSAWQGTIQSCDDIGENPARRTYWLATARAYNELFFNFDLSSTRVTVELAEAILDRMLKRRHLLAHLGIVSKRYGSWQEDKDGSPIDLPRPKNARQELADVLKRMGLAWSSTRARVSTPGITTLENNAKGGYKMGRVYLVTPGSLNNMQTYANRRNTGRVTRQVDRMPQQLNNALPSVPGSTISVAQLPLIRFSDTGWHNPATMPANNLLDVAFIGSITRAAVCDRTEGSLEDSFVV